MSHERYYNKDRSRRLRLIVNRTYKTREQVMKAAKKFKPKTAPVTVKLDQIKEKDFQLEIRG